MHPYRCRPEVLTGGMETLFWMHKHLGRDAFLLKYDLYRKTRFSTTHHQQMVMANEIFDRNIKNEKNLEPYTVDSSDLQ